MFWFYYFIFLSLLSTGNGKCTLNNLTFKVLVHLNIAPYNIWRFTRYSYLINLKVCSKINDIASKVQDLNPDIKIDKNSHTKAYFVINNNIYNITSLDKIYFDVVYNLLKSKIDFLTYKYEIYFWGYDITLGKIK